MSIASTTPATQCGFTGADIKPHGSNGEAVPITLTARVVGAFPSIGQMKHHFNASAHGIGSIPIRVTEQSLGAHPDSQIQLPDDIRPGIYSLVTTNNDDGSLVSGASSIRVADGR